MNPDPGQSQPRLLVVAHGSQGAEWVRAQRDWFAGTMQRLNHLVGCEVDGRLSFLEITPPLFGDELARAIESNTPLLVFPFFLSRSGHAGDEIPALAHDILGGAVPWGLVEPVGWEAALGRNAERRLRDAGAAPGDAVIVSGYGASKHDALWRRLVCEVQAHAGVFAGGRSWRWAPAGHFLAEASAPLREHLAEVAASGSRRAAVLPLYIAVSSYQESLIPKVLAEFPQLRVCFRPDAVLPDASVEQWAAELLASAINNPPGKTP